MDFKFDIINLLNNYSQIKEDIILLGWISFKNQREQKLINYQNYLLKKKQYQENYQNIKSEDFLHVKINI